MAMTKGRANRFTAGEFPHLRGVVRFRDEEDFAIGAKNKGWIKPPWIRNRMPDGPAGGCLPEADVTGMAVGRQGDLAVRTEGHAPDLVWALERLADGFAGRRLP